eukprot:1629221-Prymnesium_polylepis.1
MHMLSRVFWGEFWALTAVRGDLGGSSVAPGARRALSLSSLDLYYAWTFAWYAWFAAVLRHAASIRKRDRKLRAGRKSHTYENFPSATGATGIFFQPQAAPGAADNRRQPQTAADSRRQPDSR